ncbi:MAG TPA: RNA-guided pseudouridylation complex pseudouridine synthase subunit Cbf5 [Candidatus Bathyarchaeia archaeon]|nr:RNA-guided pseudouridylation complex pseudouridine synthase subunit Cbf5 [Candidatus Bathyarchaeia archaeon]
MPKLVAPWEIKRTLLVKAEEETDLSFGCKPQDRSPEDYTRFGVINLDKPSGPSSHEVTAWVKRLLGLTHAGHGGTLDPKVTGILPVTLEEATKVVQALLLSGKEYVCVMRLHRDSSETSVKSAFEEFTGPIYQLPPVRASVKRQLRIRKIYYLNLLETSNKNVLFQVGCEAGTYIRKLCYDMGEALGVGAHMQELRRTRAGPFTENNSLVTLHDVAYYQDLWQQTKDASTLRRFVQPMEKALDPLPKIIIRDSAIDAICHGANLAAPGVLALDSDIKPKDTVAVMTQKGEAVALARATVSAEEALELNRGIITKTARVLMPRGVYPKMWSKTSH